MKTNTKKPKSLGKANARTPKTKLVRTGARPGAQ